MRKLLFMISGALLIRCILSPVQAENYPFTPEDPPSITSDFLYLIDIENGEILWSLNGEEAMYPASLTKIMSAVITLEHFSDYSETIRITDAMWSGLIEENASVAGFYPGDEPTILELLYGVILPSGADAVQALMIGGFGSVEAGVAAMNQKAAELGMNSTHFLNATGLHEEGHITSAKDMALLLEYALQNPLFCEILASRTYTTGPLANSPSGLTMTSTSWPAINLGEGTYQIPGFLGGKTGFTNPAGRCFASNASFNGMHLVLVTGHSSDLGHIADAAAVYNWVSETYTRQTVAEQDSPLTDIPVIDTMPAVTFSLSVPETVERDLPADAAIDIQLSVPDQLQAPITAGDYIGTMTITANDSIIYETDLLAPADAAYSSLKHFLNAADAFRIQHPFLFWFLVVTGVLFLLLVLRIIQVQIRRRIRRARRRKKQKSRKQR